MGRILAIDYGSKRCGIAVTDPMKIISQPLTTVSSHELMHFLENYFASEDVECVVFGKPMKTDNSPSESFKLVERFAAAFRKRFPDRKTAWVDERFSSVSAVETMIRGGMKRKERQKKENIDRISAAIILQTFLDGENNT